jgi:hypothetical protein
MYSEESLEDRRLRKEVLTKDFFDKLNELDLFPGSLEEFESFKGQKYEIIDTGNRAHYVHFNPWWTLGQSDIRDIEKQYPEAKKQLLLLVGVIRMGCEAMIRYNPDAETPYGIPVKRVNP